MVSCHISLDFVVFNFDKKTIIKGSFLLRVVNKSIESSFCPILYIGKIKFGIWVYRYIELFIGEIKLGM